MLSSRNIGHNITSLLRWAGNNLALAALGGMITKDLRIGEPSHSKCLNSFSRVLLRESGNALRNFFRSREHFSIPQTLLYTLGRTTSTVQKYKASHVLRANVLVAESPVQMFSTYTSRLLTPSLLYQERQGWRDVLVAIQRKRRDASYRSSAEGAPKSHLPPACRNE